MEHQISAHKIFSGFVNLLLLLRVHYTASHKSQKYKDIKEDGVLKYIYI